MYIVIDNITGEKTIDLSYPIHSGKEAPEGPHSAEVTVITMFNDNV